MAVTYRTLLNRVLRAVSEDEIDSTVDTITDDYHKLIGTFVNLTLEEVQAANPQWRALQQTLTADIPATENTGEIVGATDQSQLVRVRADGREAPIVFDITDPTVPVPMRELSLAQLKYKQQLDPTATTNNAPVYFAVDDTDTDAMKLLVHPAPNANRTISLVMTVPQGRFDDDDLDVAIKIPTLPVELGSIWYALQERGEELGVSNVFTEERYRNALDAAVTRDLSEQGGYELVPV